MLLEMDKLKISQYIKFLLEIFNSYKPDKLFQLMV